MSNRRTLSLKGVKFARIDDYFGLWAIDEMRGLAMFDRVRQLDLVAHVSEGDRERRRSTVRSETLTPKAGDTDGVAVAVIRIDGTMMKHASSFDDSTSTVQVRKEIRAAANNPLISGIMLLFDSPGGTVAGTADLAREVSEAAAKKPVHAFVEDLCASAAYWILSQCDVAHANDATALVGSIGTFIGLYDVSKAAEKEGIEALVFKTGSLKGAAFPGTRITDEQKSYFQSIVDQTQTHFSAAVREGRGLSSDEVAGVATGGVFMAEEAVKLGLIDGIKTYEQAIGDLFTAITNNRDRRNASHQEQTMKLKPNASDPSAPTEEPKKPEEGKPADEAKQPEQAPETKPEGDKPAEASKPAETQPEAKDLAAARAAEGKRFKSEFGDDRGSRYFADGLTFEQAQAQYAKDLKAENEQLKGKLAAVDRGEQQPVSASPEKPKSEPAAKSAKLEQNLGKGLAAFAGSIKLPSSNN